MSGVLTVLAASGLLLQEAGTIPVLVDATSGVTSLDDSLCFRDACMMYVTPGKHVLARHVRGSDALKVDGSAPVVVARPSILSLSGPPPLHSVGGVILGLGASILLAGILVPLLACQSSTHVDAATGIVVSTNPCRDVSDPVKVGWIAGLGIGLTLSTAGAILFFNTSSAPRPNVSPWDYAHDGR